MATVFPLQGLRRTATRSFRCCLYNCNGMNTELRCPAWCTVPRSAAVQFGCELDELLFSKLEGMLRHWRGWYECHNVSNVLPRKQVLTKTHPYYKLITRLLNNQPTREAAWKHLIPCPVGALPRFCAETR